MSTRAAAFKCSAGTDWAILSPQFGVSDCRRSRDAGQRRCLQVLGGDRPGDVLGAAGVDARGRRLRDAGQGRCLQVLVAD